MNKQNETCRDSELLMEKNKLSWKRMRFKKNKVWLAIRPDGNPMLKDGKVLIKYQPDQDYEYWVNPKAVKPLDAPAAETGDRPKRKAGQKLTLRADRRKVMGSPTLKEIPDEEAVCIFTDGASSGNPGPSGIGVVLRYGKHRKEVSRYIGRATNNIAELKAIQAALLALKDRELPVRIFTDSSYAYGILALGWKPRKNQDLVENIKNTISKFKGITFIKVKGHSGHADNERADFLATSAVKKAEMKKST
jgi:ribonuclease HI